jgi:trimethylamine-N-oxide reductase (cytochrome c)
VYFRWYAEDRKKDVPEPHPLPSQYAEEFGKGLQTPSGKIEFVATTIARGDPANPERPALNRYIPAWEGPRNGELGARYPLQLTLAHSRYSFHTYCDGKDSAINDIDEHRVRIGGYDYWVLRMSASDAATRGIAHHDLVRVRNDRGAVICAADVSPLIASGVVKAYQASASFDPVEDAGGVTDRAGCLNMLTPSRPQIRGTDAMAANSCLVEVEPLHA